MSRLLVVDDDDASRRLVAAIFKAEGHSVAEANDGKAGVAAAEALAPDLIVMGTRGHGPVRRALLGSVASRVMESALMDVLVVPEHERAGSPRISRMTRGMSRPAAGPSVAKDSRRSFL